MLAEPWSPFGTVAVALTLTEARPIRGPQRARCSRVGVVGRGRRRARFSRVGVAEVAAVALVPREDARLSRQASISAADRVAGIRSRYQKTVQASFQAQLDHRLLLLASRRGRAASVLRRSLCRATKRRRRVTTRPRLSPEDHERRSWLKWLNLCFLQLFFQLREPRARHSKV